MQFLCAESALPRTVEHVQLGEPLGVHAPLRVLAQVQGRAAA